MKRLAKLLSIITIAATLYSMDAPFLVSRQQAEEAGAQFIKKGLRPEIIEAVMKAHEQCINSTCQYKIIEILKTLTAMTQRPEPIPVKPAPKKAPIIRQPLGETKSDSASAFGTELQISLIPNRTTISGKLTNEKNLQLLSSIPAIGHYLSEEYNFRKRLMVIELPTNKFIAPQNIKAAITKFLGSPPKAISDSAFANLLRSKGYTTINTNIVINGIVSDPSKDSADKSYNLIFHPWLSNLHGGGTINKKINMGVFHPYNIQAAPQANAAPIKNIAPRGINVHPAGKGLALSPDNVRLKTAGSVSHFWSVAIEPDKKGIVVTLHILANNPAAEKYLTFIINTVRERGFGDKQAVEDFLDLLKNLKGEQTPAAQTDLEKAIEAMRDALNKATA